MKKQNVLDFFFRQVSRLIPKKKNLVIFESFPDFSDNVYHLFEYMNNNEKIKKKYSLIWLVNDEKIHEKLLKKKIKTYKKFSLRGIFVLLRSKYIFISHTGFLNVKSKNQILINLWHGMPLKAMMFLDDSKTESDVLKGKKINDNINFLISTSKIMQIALASAFYTNPRKIHLVGQPRNDKLFNYESKKRLSDLLNSDLSNYEKIVIFCPTFRKSEFELDGVSQKFNLFNFTDYHKQIFHDYLVNNKILFLVKFHPFEEKYYLSKLNNKKITNIVFITQEMLQSALVDLYDILGGVDILITDYSSIYFDFLLLNKPIIFTPTDLKQYQENRGLILEPYDFWTPGPKVTTFKDFLTEFKKCIDNPTYYSEERKLINNIVNKYQDDKSCERVFKLVFEN